MNASLALAIPPISNDEAGLRTDSASLVKLEVDLMAALMGSPELTSAHGAKEAWDANCQHHWRHVNAIFGSIHRMAAVMDEAITSAHPQAALLAWAIWEGLQCQEPKLAVALSALRERALELDETAAGHWSALALIIESNGEAVQSGIQGMRVRLETWMQRCPLESPAKITRICLPAPGV